MIWHGMKKFSSLDVYHTGQMVSLTGTWMQQIIVVWLCYQYTHSVSLLALLTVIHQLPILLLTPVGGRLAYVYKAGFWLQTLTLIQLSVAALLGGLFIFNQLNPVWIFVLTALLGCCTALELPIRHVWLQYLAFDSQHSKQQIAISSMIYNGSRWLGAILASLMLYMHVPLLGFILNIISFISVLMIMCKLSQQDISDLFSFSVEQVPTSVHRSLRSIPPSSVSLSIYKILLVAVSFIVAPLLSFLPEYADLYLKSNRFGLGFLLSCSAFGALCAGFLKLRFPNLMEKFNISYALLWLSLLMMSLPYTQHILMAGFWLLLCGGLLVWITTGIHHIFQSHPHHSYAYHMAQYHQFYIGGMLLSGLFYAWLVAGTDIYTCFIVAANFALFTFVLSIFVLNRPWKSAHD